MKILFLTNALRVGGIEKNVVRLARELQGDHDVMVVSAGGTLVPELEKAGARHRELSLKVAPLAILRTARRLKAILREEQPDLIHSFSASASVALWVTKRLLRASGDMPTISSIMGLKNSPSENRLLTWARAYATTFAADRVLVIAPAIAAALARTPVRRTRLIELPVVGVPLPDNGAHPQRHRSELRRELAVGPDALVVMTMGNLEPRKSHDLFIRAAAEVLRSVPDAHFFIIGGGVLGEELRSEIDRTGRGDRIVMLGERAEGPRLLDACDIYVRPGVVEGFVGITVLEAQAVRVPVIAFETEDVKLAIDDGVTGVLVPNGDVAALATAIVSLAQDRDKRSLLAEAAFRHVEETFSMKAVAAGLSDLYEKVAEHRGG